MELNEIHPEHEQATTTLKVVLLVFAIVLVGTLAYLVGASNNASDTTDNSAPSVKKSVDETASWKTYVNSRVNYSFEYPSMGLTLDLDETIKYPSTSVAENKTEDLVQYATKTVSYSIQTNVGVTATSLESWMQDSNTSHVDGDLSKYTKTLVSGKTAYTFTGELRTYVMSGGNVYEIIGYKGEAPSTDTNDKTYSHLISSFKFTK